MLLWRSLNDLLYIFLVLYQFHWIFCPAEFAGYYNCLRIFCCLLVNTSKRGLPHCILNSNHVLIRVRFCSDLICDRNNRLSTRPLQLILYHFPFKFKTVKIILIYVKNILNWVTTCFSPKRSLKRTSTRRS